MEIHHLALRTRDLPALGRFYAEVVGLGRPEPTPRGGLWLRAGHVVLMLEPAEGDEPAPAAGGKDLLAFAVTKEEQLALRARLRAADVAVEDETAHTVYFRDPDGRRVGASTYAFAPPSDGARA